MTKLCVRCGASEFNKRGECLPCKRAYTKAYAAKNRDALILKKRERYEREKSELQAKAREYYERNKEDRVEYGRAYRASNPDAFLASQKSYRDNNKEKRNSWRRGYSKKFPEKMLNYNRKRSNNIGCHRLSDGLMDLLMSEQGGKCAGCGTDLSCAIVHLDHFMPLKLGGRNIDSNMQLLCKPCNQTKHAKLPSVWMAQNPHISDITSTSSSISPV